MTTCVIGLWITFILFWTIFGELERNLTCETLLFITIFYFWILFSFKGVIIGKAFTLCIVV
jgi:hypothetical protein